MVLLLKEVKTMTSKEILHAIVEQEHLARRGYDEVCQKVDGYDDYIAQKREQMRSDVFAAADERLSALEAEETAKTGRQLEAMEEKQSQDFAYANRWYQNHRDEFVERVFSMVVNSDV